MNNENKIKVLKWPLLAAIAFVGVCLIQTRAHWQHGSGGQAHFSPPMKRGPLPVDSVQTAKNVQPPPIHPVAPPEAPLWLVLIGTKIGKNSHEGIAFIGTNLRSPRTYQVGALLANKARLQEIYSDYIVLERDGITTRLYALGKQPAEPLPTEPALLTVGGPTQTPSAIADSSDALTDVMRVSPTFEGKLFSGLIVFANPRSDLFYRLGFQPGDVITAIDGTTFNDPASAIAALRSLTNGQPVSVTINRANQASTFSANGSVLVSNVPVAERRSR